MTYAEGWSYTAREWQMNLKRAGTTPPPWKAPRLLKDGRKFEPGGVEPGAWVSIRQGDETAVGQVWSLSPRGAWVVVEDAERGTRAVEACVRPGCKRTMRCAGLVHPKEGA